MNYFAASSSQSQLDGDDFLCRLGLNFMAGGIMAPRNLTPAELHEFDHLAAQ